MIWVAALAAQAAALPAAPHDPGDVPGEHRWHSEQTFIAPSGEPFHAPQGSPYPVAAWFAQADANHDGKLTEAEFTADAMRFFDRLDSNHDNEIDAAEITNYEETIAPEVHAPTWYGQFGGKHGDDGDDESGAKAHAAQAEPVEGAGRFDLLGIPEPIASMDTDLTGRVTRRQALEAASVRFDALDTLHRGYLTPDQLPETFIQRHKHGVPESGRKGGGHGRGHGGGQHSGRHGDQEPSDSGS